MSKKILLGLFALMMTVASFGNVAEASDRRVDPKLVRQVLSWVEARMGARAPSLPVVMASRDRFDLVMNMAGVSYADARALYIPGSVILGDDDWSHTDPTKLSLLVHELVHHVQMFNKRKYACNDAKEYEAYIIQNEWLKANGQRPFASQHWIDRMSSCGAY
ncbi:MAG: hypothetical protein EBZ69_05760 [Alphaproteobacteria bacterium]|nr:hypothetical protein [Alphaproteobacteria bacterium]NDC56297.1 hypothetical protein [Alphaproteobacteria bacterium]